MFFDIIFADVPGVFFSKYHTFPADYFYAFYDNRKDLIDARVKLLASWPATKKQITDTYRAHHPKNTLCIGLSWRYPLNSVLEIAECLHPALPTICRLLYTNYRVYASGIPDLCVWNVDRKECRFVEVKSENDTLSDNQRIWIHNLTNAGVPVDLCKVLHGAPRPKKRQRRT